MKLIKNNIFNLILTVLIIFCLQSWTKAEDIRDFQIEGMSIGDSLLDFYKIDKINSAPKAYYPNSKKQYLTEFSDNLKTYDVVAVHIKENDKQFKITSIKGVIFYNKKIKKCKKKMKEVELDISKSLNIEKKLYEEKEYPDKRGKAYITEFEINKDSLRIWCVDFYKKAEKSGTKDNLSVSIEPFEFSKWLKDEAW